MSMYEPPYKINDKIIFEISNIMNKIGNIESYQTLDRLPKLRKQNRIRSIYSSCAIEANSLSLNDVKDLINGKTVVGSKEEILEVKNAIKAYEIIENIDPYSLKDLLNEHKILTTGLVDNAGTFRKNQEGVFDGEKCIFIAPPANMVVSLMESLFAWINKNKTNIHPLILSCVFHYEFVFIHPFKDGNGRMARLWHNALLGKFNPIFYWLPIENYIKDHQEDYYNAISKSHIEGESTEFICFMLKMISEALDKIKTDINLHVYHSSIYINRLLENMDENVPMTSNEIMLKLRIKSKETFRKNYLNPAIESGLVEFEIPDKPTSKNQRYIKK